MSLCHLQDTPENQPHVSEFVQSVFVDARLRSTSITTSLSLLTPGAGVGIGVHPTCSLSATWPVRWGAQTSSRLTDHRSQAAFAQLDVARNIIVNFMILLPSSPSFRRIMAFSRVLPLVIFLLSFLASSQCTFLVVAEVAGVPALGPFLVFQNLGYRRRDQVMI